MAVTIDLEELERLHSEAAGTPYKAKDCWIYAQSVSHKRTFSRRPMAYTIDNRDGRYKPTETAAYIVAACNAVPELVAELKEARAENGELKRHSEWLERKLQIRIDNNAELIKRVRELEAELATYKQPIDFPKLRESVSHIDNNLGEYLEDSIKRAAARP